MTNKPHFMDGLRPFLEKPVLSNFLLGWAEAAPLTLISGILGYWLFDVGVSLETIGLVTLATLPHATKILWAPLIDRLSLGPITNILGQRRGWFFLIQVLMALSIWGLAGSTPKETPEITGIFVLAIGFLSASQDILIDAYRIEIMKKHQYAHGATMFTYGYRVVGIFFATPVLFLAAYFPWELVITISPILLLPGILAFLWNKEPEDEGLSYIKEEEEKLKKSLDARDIHGRKAAYITWFNDAVILPFKEFMTRPGWWVLLLFIALFKVSDVLVAAMTAPFLRDMQYDLVEIAAIGKAVGSIMLTLGVLTGALLYAWAGLYRSLLVTAVLMMVTNLMFVWVAISGHDLVVLTATMAAENFASSLGNVAVVVFLTSLTNRAFTATQYALLSSFSALARPLIGSSSGFMVANLGWESFFFMSALTAIPSIIVLWYLWKKGWGGMREKPEKNESAKAS